MTENASGDPYDELGRALLRMIDARRALSAATAARHFEPPAEETETETETEAGAPERTGVEAREA